MLPRCPRAILVLWCALPLLSGCETITTAAVATDEALYGAVPTHPVTGRAMANVVSEDREIAIAQEAWNRLSTVAASEGVQVDLPGPRLEQIQRVFRNLVSVAHRQHLPWEIHLLRHPLPNAMTPGGGMVFIFDGIFTDHPSGKGFLRPADDELAAVLAHEIAHVTLMHMAERETSSLFTSRLEKDPYYGASYSTADEAEADRLSVLYMALAGYDPMAAPRVWYEANNRYGSDPGAHLYDHPINAERMRATAEAAEQVRGYYEPGVQNDDWAVILIDNPLFPRAAAREQQPGAGVAKAVEATLEAVERHRATKDEAKLRERAAAQSPQVQATLVRLLETKLDDQGRALIWMRFHNSAGRDVSDLGVRVTYQRQQQPIAQDPNCGGPATIPAGQTVWLACAYQQVAGADSLNVEITSVEFR